MTLLMSRVHQDLEFVFGRWSGTGLKPWEQPKPTLEEMQALVAFSPVRLSREHLHLMCGSGDRTFRVVRDSLGAAPWFFQVYGPVTALRRNRELEIQRQIPESLVVGECDWDMEGGGMLVLLPTAEPPGLYRLPLNGPRDVRRGRFIAPGVEDLLREARHVERLFPRFAQAAQERSGLAELLHPALRVVPEVSAEALREAERLEVKAQAEQLARVRLKAEALKNPLRRSYLPVLSWVEMRRRFWHGAFSPELLDLVGEGPGVELEVTAWAVVGLDDAAPVQGAGVGGPLRLRFYSVRRCLEVGREGPAGLRLPEVLVLGDNARGDLLVLAPQAWPSGVYRVPGGVARLAPGLPAEAGPPAVAWGESAHGEEYEWLPRRGEPGTLAGTGRAVYLAPNLTQLLEHGLGLERVFAPVPPDTGTGTGAGMDAQARRARLVEDSCLRMRRKHAVLVRDPYLRFLDLWEEEKRELATAGEPLLEERDWPEQLGDRMREKHFAQHAPSVDDPPLKDLLSTHLNVECEDIAALGEWIQGIRCDGDDSVERLKLLREFKADLRTALDEPGRVTPQLFERWTGWSVETQKEVQAILEDVWNTCFPAEPRYEVERASPAASAAGWDSGWQTIPPRVHARSPEFQRLVRESQTRLYAVCLGLPDDAIFYFAQHYWHWVSIAGAHEDPVLDFPDWPERVYERLRAEFFPQVRA